MPCFDPRDNEQRDKDYADFRVLKREHAATLSHLNERTDQLCRVMKSLEENVKHIYDTLPKDIRDWHLEHKVFDKKSIPAKLKE